MTFGLRLLPAADDDVDDISAYIALGHEHLIASSRTNGGKVPAFTNRG